MPSLRRSAPHTTTSPESGFGKAKLPGPALYRGRRPAPGSARASRHPAPGGSEGSGRVISTTQFRVTSSTSSSAMVITSGSS